MLKIKRKFFRSIRGTILPAAALFVAVIIPLCGITVDVSYMGILRGSLDRATEAAAVAGANEYFRSMADAGRAVDETMRVFKMNVSNDSTVGRYHSATGAGRPQTYEFSRTFSESDGIQIIYRGQPISLTTMTELNRGKVTVTSEVTPKPFFSQIFSTPTPIKITKTAELPPYDIAFVYDLSGSMRFATNMTFIGSAWREDIRTMTSVFLADVILYQSQDENWGQGTMITSGRYTITIDMITDSVINTPSVDIDQNARYDNGRPMYINDPKRGLITNTENSRGLRRTVLSGLTLAEARLDGQEGLGLFNSATANRLSTRTREFRDYFNQAAAYIEPQASATYGVMSFIDTVRIYGTAQLNLALVTFQTRSLLKNYWEPQGAWELRSATSGWLRRINNTYPYVMLVEPRDFNDITDALTIMHNGGLGLSLHAFQVNSYPNGGTNISDGLENAWETFQRSGRRNRNPQRVIILFTDGDPTGGDSYPRLGRTVRNLTDQGVTVYSIVLTLAVGQGTINNFRNAVENVGMAEPVIFVNNPQQIDDAFINIANDLGLRLVN